MTVRWTPYIHSPEEGEDSDSIPWQIHLPLESEETSSEPDRETKAEPEKDGDQ